MYVCIVRKEKIEKILSSFFKAFSKKKKIFGGPYTRSLHIKKLMTYTRYDGRNNLIEYSKIEKR